MADRILLTDMNFRENGIVVEISGGGGVQRRLKSIGIRPGAKVTKLTAAFGRGPVILKVGGTQIALGFGMSHKVVIEVER
ncbi:MAG: ferrous iron transport protein A [Candidatus Omnitrophica bacterium]|nr:ferrous iron transport protein A [Candidatus Omnitrophota bacterium]